MSIRLMSAVWDSRRYESGTLLVLLAMADYANDEDATCHPSIRRLADKSRLSDRQVSRILSNLKDDGVITPVGERPTAQGRPIVVYRINVGALRKGDICDNKGDTMSPLDPAKGDICDAKGDICDTLKVTPMSYDPSIGPSYDPSIEEGAATPPPPTAADPPSWFEDVPEPEPQQPPAPPTPTTKALTQHPTVAMYRDVFLRYPSRPQMSLLMAHGVDDLRRWNDVLTVWVGRGWSPNNLQGMLDLYNNPRRISELRSSYTPRPTQAQAQPPRFAQERAPDFADWLAELSRPGAVG